MAQINFKTKEEVALEIESLPKSEMELQKEEIAQLKEKLIQSEEDNKTSLLAIAELYEMILG